MTILYLYIFTTCSFMAGLVFAEHSDASNRSVIGMSIQVLIAPFILPILLGAITYELSKKANNG